MHEVLRDVAVVRALEVVVGIDEVGDRTRGAGHAVDVLAPRTSVSAQALVAARGERTKGGRRTWGSTHELILEDLRDRPHRGHLAVIEARGVGQARHASVAPVADAQVGGRGARVASARAGQVAGAGREQVHHGRRRCAVRLRGGGGDLGR
eukprot:COSAG06_NODE_3427_length_5361_cov_715.776923_3_plen_151_part_00